MFKGCICNHERVHWYIKYLSNSMDNKLLRKLIIPQLAKTFPYLRVYENGRLLCIFTKLTTEQFPWQFEFI